MIEYEKKIAQQTFNILKKKFDFSMTPFYSSKELCVINSSKLEANWLGCRTQLSNIPQGSMIYNVGKNFHYLGSFGRAAGTYCQIIVKNDEQNNKKVENKLKINQI